MEYVSRLFDQSDELEAWGLRGYEFLYYYMKDAFSKTPLPISEDEFKSKFEQYFVGFEEFIQKSGTMSNKPISIEVCRDKQLSMLLERLREYKPQDAKSMKYVSELFDPKPDGAGAWGLREDEFLYDDMKEAFSKTPLPISEDEFKVEFERYFLLMTGHSISEESFFVLEKYRRKHGRINGGIHPESWRGKQLSRLLERLREYHLKLLE